MKHTGTVLPSVIPAPHTSRMTGRRLTMPATVSLEPPEAASAADTLVSYAKRTHGVYFTVQPMAGAVGFARDAAMPSEAYRITLGDSVTVTAAGGADQRQHRAALQCEADAAQYLRLPEGFAEIPHLQRGWIRVVHIAIPFTAYRNLPCTHGTHSEKRAIRFSSLPNRSVSTPLKIR